MVKPLKEGIREWNLWLTSMSDHKIDPSLRPWFRRYWWFEWNVLWLHQWDLLQGESGQNRTITKVPGSSILHLGKLFFYHQKYCITPVEYLWFKAFQGILHIGPIVEVTSRSPDGAENSPQNLPESADENRGGKHLQSSNNPKFEWNGKNER